MRLLGDMVDPSLVGLLVADVATSADLPVVETVRALADLEAVLSSADATALEVRVVASAGGGVEVSGTFDAIGGVTPVDNGRVAVEQGSPAGFRTCIHCGGKR